MTNFNLSKKIEGGGRMKLWEGVVFLILGCFFLWLGLSFMLAGKIIYGTDAVLLWVSGLLTIMGINKLSYIVGFILDKTRGQKNGFL